MKTLIKRLRCALKREVAGSIPVEDEIFFCFSNFLTFFLFFICFFGSFILLSIKFSYFSPFFSPFSSKKVEKTVKKKSVISGNPERYIRDKMHEIYVQNQGTGQKERYSHEIVIARNDIARFYCIRPTIIVLNNKFH